MSLGLPVGRVFGIPIRLHISWLILLVLLVSMLQPLFATPVSDGVALAILATTLLLLSTLLHELGHALVARQLGLSVDSITLFMTGGFTTLQVQTTQPGQELRIALAGPFMSLALAGISGIAALLTSGPFSLLWLVLAGSNALLVAFNLLPSHPLDGGRALRAVLWFLHDDMLRGTQVAAWVGRVFGGVLLLLGVVVLISGNLLAGVVAIMIGWGMQRSALNGYIQTVVQHTLTRLSVADVMSRTFRTVSPHMTLDLFVGQYLLGQSEQSFPVVQAERLLGLIGTRNLRRFSVQQWRQFQVSDAMTPSADLPTLQPGDSAQAAFHELIARRVEQLPVTDGGDLLGMVRRTDLLSRVQQAIRDAR